MAGETGSRRAPRFRLPPRHGWKDAAIVAAWLGLSVAFVAQIAAPVAPHAAPVPESARRAPAAAARHALLARAAPDGTPCVCPPN